MEPQISELDELRIVKPIGFRGITLPIMVVLKNAEPQTAANYTTPFFIANRNYTIFEVKERHQTAGSDAGAVTLQIEKLANGVAPGSGVNCLTAGFNLKATANTLQTGAIVATAGQYIEKGQALTLKSSGTLDSVVGVTVHVLLKAV